VILVGDRAGILAAQYPSQALLYRLEGKPVTPRRESIAVLTVLFVFRMATMPRSVPFLGYCVERFLGFVQIGPKSLIQRRKPHCPSDVGNKRGHSQCFSPQATGGDEEPWTMIFERIRTAAEPSKRTNGSVGD